MNNLVSNKHESIDDLCWKLETTYRKGGLKTSGNEVQTLATVMTFSALNTAIDPQRKAKQAGDSKVRSTYYNPRLMEIKKSLVNDFNNLRKLAYSLTHSTMMTEGQGRVVINPELAKAAQALASLTLGEGMDIFQDCCLAIMEELDAGHVNFLQSYRVRKLDKRVAIRNDENASWHEEEITPLQACYRKASESIRNSRVMHDIAVNGYSYIEELVTDPVSNKVDLLYRRLGKYADLGGYDSTIGLYSANPTKVKDYQQLVDDLGLTPVQRKVFDYMDSTPAKTYGHGTKAIAKALNISPNSAKSAVREIKRKATEMTGGCGISTVNPETGEDSLQAVTKVDLRKPTRRWVNEVHGDLTIRHFAPKCKVEIVEVANSIKPSVSVVNTRNPGKSSWDVKLGKRVYENGIETSTRRKVLPWRDHDTGEVLPAKLTKSTNVYKRATRKMVDGCLLETVTEKTVIEQVLEERALVCYDRKELIIDPMFRLAHNHDWYTGEYTRTTTTVTTKLVSRIYSTPAGEERKEVASEENSTTTNRIDELWA